ncbi:hypothetical protein DFH08DRAFT_908462 [Mycena albidolilacea]|uniref:Transmembrane protein n=1 Tax=Mycena albidolilacea TaxID=1033008 RepID=A0AAD6YWD7_9AGAR|nr:hypothetical protein DFH08DRAFT_908462 [Mycena albidolilacea]
MSLVLIDDSDTVVKYNTPGGWIEDGIFPEFNQTAHASATPGDTATLVFEGTSISVYGSQAPSGGESRLKFFVDGADVGSYQPVPVTDATHNQLFWTSPIFDEASHTLVVTVDPSDTSSSQQESPLKRAFWLDYFIYQTTSTVGKTVVIDDNDPSVTYSPKWTPNQSDARLESTRHVSNSQLDGAWAAVSFNGTGISLFGSSGSPGPDQEFKASVAIDESQAGTISQTNENQLFDSGVLPPGPHTINVTVLDGHSLVIDYFLVKNDPEIPFVAPTAGSSTSASESTIAPSPLGTTQVSKAPPIAAIVGGVVGGLVLLLLLLVAALMWRRRARRSNQPASSYPVMSDPWAGKRISVTSMTTLTEDNESQRPKNFGKQRPPSRYMYYE